MRAGGVVALLLVAVLLGRLLWIGTLVAVAGSWEAVAGSWAAVAGSWEAVASSPR